MAKRQLDVGIIGGGPAGLSAATYLARFRREVTVFDSGQSRAALIPISYNCPGHPEGINGRELLGLLRRQAQRFGAGLVTAEVTGVTGADGRFALSTGLGEFEASAVIFATGIVDFAPDIPRLHDSVESGALRLCPVCDGFELAGKRVGVIGPADQALKEAEFLLTFTPDVLLLGTSPAAFPEQARERAAALGIGVHDTITAFQPRRDGYDLVMPGGEVIALHAIYPAMGCRQNTELMRPFALELDSAGGVIVDSHQQTGVEGLYAIGDVVSALNQIAVAYGHAAIAAMHIHNRLRGKRRTPAGQVKTSPAPAAVELSATRPMPAASGAG